MKKLHSFTLLFAIPLSVNFCTNIPIETPEETSKKRETIKVLVQTIDETGRGIPANLVYEPQDCEYDFNQPSTISTNKKGIVTLTIQKGYLQLYAEGFLHESYKCQYLTEASTVKIFAAPIPTFIQVLDSNGNPLTGTLINYFINSSGHCDFEDSSNSSIIKTDSKGFAKVYLSPSETYKIQVEKLVECFQPSQKIDTLVFVK